MHLQNFYVFLRLLTGVPWADREHYAWARRFQQLSERSAKENSGAKDSGEAKGSSSNSTAEASRRGVVAGWRIGAKEMRADLEAAIQEELVAAIHESLPADGRQTPITPARKVQ